MSDDHVGIATFMDESPQGIVVLGFVPGSPAANVLRRGDIVSSVNGAQVSSLSEVRELIVGPAGSTAQVGVFRNGRLSEVTVLRWTSAGNVGLGVQLVTSARDGQLRIVSVTPGGTAGASRRVGPGDILVHVNNRPLRGLKPEEIAPLVLGPVGTSLRVGILRNGKFFEVDLVRRIPSQSQVPQQHRPRSSPPRGNARDHSGPMDSGRMMLRVSQSNTPPTVAPECLCEVCNPAPPAKPGDIEHGPVREYKCRECSHRLWSTIHATRNPVKGVSQPKLCEKCSRATGRCFCCMGALSQSTVFVPASMRR
mmetsp:Transcript_12398/g.28594  ORF Transcript_12398/g.28594 Transcript_12398/m.28594 type:complete len:309 (-) Transcript_12398:110-1036(-)|eukprot:CAMPEP_0114553420 /NCGR_PEP_ID=MMETSP0114-20121206/7651_1 /TAXON_ID=31324 /ORGANISM="Goniomonas sp, Strain m" /LENGTH=308 /DNA_ID=CAMNT_0001738367 /DNA_START=17 /DNA_END=943 /DNA_ORIENTATION=+